MTENNHIAILNGKALPRYQTTELGIEKLCIHCADYYPLTAEFWIFNRKMTKFGYVSRAVGACKGCYREKYQPHRVVGSRPLKSSYEVSL